MAAYSPGKLDNALKRIEDGFKSFVQASASFNIPCTTLIYKYDKNRTRELCKPGSEYLLSKFNVNTLSNFSLVSCFLFHVGREMEKLLYCWTLETSDKGLGLKILRIL